MPPDLPNEQELTLKKRARRRLVGAMALVLLMIIVLPKILQDRALLTQQEPITIIMPEVAKSMADTTVNNPAVVTPVTSEPIQQDVAAAGPASAIGHETIAELPVSAAIAVKETDNKKENDIAVPKSAEKKIAAIPSEISKPDINMAAKSDESFTIQVGVYSDLANVKRLQEQLKQAGFSTHTEKVKTPKGESLRLKAGNFNSRDAAVTALAKIKSIGMTGIVITNE